MLTPNQLKLYRFIEAYKEEIGVTPTYEEMAAEMGLKSKSNIHSMISNMEKRGAIKKVKYMAHGIRLRPLV